MKKSIILLAITVLGIVGFQSCKKEEHHQPPVVTNLNIALTQNEAYAFTLPANTTPKPYRISNQAGHYTISFVSKDATGNEIYQYTPALNYNGTDKVTVENTKEGAPDHGNGGGCNHHQGHGGHDDDDDEVQANIVNINFTIGTATSTTATIPVFSGLVK